MQIALDKFEPPLNGFEVPVGTVEPRVHRRTQVDVQADVHADADQHRGERDRLADCHPITILRWARGQGGGQEQGLDGHGVATAI
jgi:hypothetical protein